ncbi:MAG: hypothetical protein M9894_11130 [Planctomycetes bacterium]|nr:hypothetical protein [Planctomycetota bacterium]
MDRYVGRRNGTRRVFSVVSEVAHPESLGEGGLDPARVVHRSEDDHQVVRVADQEGLAFQTGSDLALEPRVHDRVEVDVGEGEAEITPPLRSAFVGDLERPLFEHTCLEPLVDRAAQHAVTHPLVEDRSEMGVVQGVEELPDVHLEHPAPVHVHRSFPEGLERLVLTAWAESRTKVQEVLLVDGPSAPWSPPLEDLVLDGRDPYGSGFCAVPLGMYASPEGPVGASLEAFQQVLEVALQTLCILGRRLAIHPRSPVLASAPIGPRGGSRSRYGARAR